ncbi:hypothetical protein IL306_009416 [Fusarium sp. DS 682]|nr:hypothetical protein IL306_009416 [Fusarium sp. DS 682]
MGAPQPESPMNEDMPDSTPAQLDVDSGYGESSKQSMETNDGLDDASAMSCSQPQSPNVVEQQRVPIRPIAKAIDEQTARRANDVMEQMSGLLQEHMAKSRRRRYLSKSKRQLPGMSIRAIMLGTTIEDAKTCLVISCTDEDGAHGIIPKFLRKSLVKDLYQPSDNSLPSFDVHIFGASPRTRCGVEIGIPPGTLLGSPHYSTLCGIRIFMVKGDAHTTYEVEATLGGILQITSLTDNSVSNRFYGLTAAHEINALLNDDDPCDDVSMSDSLSEGEYDEDSSTSSSISDADYQHSPFEIDFGVSKEDPDDMETAVKSMANQILIARQPFSSQASNH